MFLVDQRVKITEYSVMEAERHKNKELVDYLQQH